MKRRRTVMWSQKGALGAPEAMTGAPLHAISSFSIVDVMMTFFCVGPRSWMDQFRLYKRKVSKVDRTMYQFSRLLPNGTLRAKLGAIMFSDPTVIDGTLRGGCKRPKNTNGNEPYVAPASHCIQNQRVPYDFLPMRRPRRRRSCAVRLVRHWSTFSSSNRRAALGDSPDRGGQRFGNKV
jgi:hypothetical protein